jgi:hypothetical protein
MTDDEQRSLRHTVSRILDLAYRSARLKVQDIHSLIADTHTTTIQTLELGRALRSLHARAVASSPDFAKAMFAEEIERWQLRVEAEQDGVDDAKVEARFLYPFAVVRQEPVGHGGFHSGTLGFARPLFRWVYDCGSWRKRHALEKRIAAFLERSRSDYDRPDIDILFLSHFDADHVNGLQALFAEHDEMSTRVRTVVAPYLAPLDVFAAVGRAVARDNCPPEFLQAATDPEGYFQDKGVENLVLVRPDEPPAPGPDGVDPPTPPLASPSSAVDPNALMSAEFFDAAGQPIPMPLPVYGEIGVIIAEPGCFFEMATYGRWLDWMFVPHAHRWNFNREQLADRVRRTVGLDPAEPEFNTALVGLLRTKLGVKSIKKIYCGMESNGTSMSLYLGPRATRGVKRKLYARPKDPAGWLMTGDAPLSRPEAFGQWKRAYAPVTVNAGRVMLPHHGAERNFNPDLLSFAPKAIPFLTVDGQDYANKKRPPAKVRARIKRHFDPVTESRGITEVSGEPDGSDRLAIVSEW